MYRFSLLLVLFGMVSTVTAQAPADANQPAKEAEKKLSVAHIEIKGSYSEGAGAGGLFSEIVETLSDALQRLKKAASDDSLDAVIIHIVRRGLAIWR